MKIRVTLEVGDELRRAIALADPKAAKTDWGLATRAAVRQWIDDRVYKAENAAEMWIKPDRPTAVEEAEGRDAIEYLRRGGWADDRIARWLMAQRAYREKLPLPPAAAEVIPFPLRPESDVPRGT